MLYSHCQEPDKWESLYKEYTVSNTMSIAQKTDIGWI